MAATDLNKSTLKVADKFGKELVKELQSQLLKAGKDATGTLIKTMKHEVKSANGKILIEVSAAHYFRYVDKGRKAYDMDKKHWPPIQPIKEWVQVRGILPALAFTIRANIGKFGIKALNILSPTVKKVTIEFLPHYEKEMAKFIGVRMLNDVFGQTNTKGQIIPKGFK